MPKTPQSGVKADRSKYERAFYSTVRKFIDLKSSAFTTELSNLIDKNEVDKIVRLSVDPLGYSDPRNYLFDAQALAFFSKNVSLNTSINKREVAIGKFLESEIECKKTNERLKRIRPGSVVDRIIFLASTYFERTFTNDIDYSRFSLNSGNDLSNRGRKRAPTERFVNSSVNPQSLPLLYKIVMANPGLYEAYSGELKLINYNVLTTVPKNSKTDRCIAMEPSWNVIIQRQLGQYMRKEHYINNAQHIRTMAEKHSNKMALASVKKDTCTIDLSSASDTISSELVYLLATRNPNNIRSINLVDTLDSLRSKLTKLPNGNLHINSKFSSMGNGYTFELETIIFYCLVKAVCSFYNIEYSDLSVYGDDIILPSEAYHRTIRFLSVCGFTTNKEKSFGPNDNFRESCGSDWHSGTYVRPVYFDKIPKTEHEYVMFLNKLSQIGIHLHWNAMGYTTDPRFVDSALLRRDHVIKKVWIDALRIIPVSRRIFGPYSMGDRVIWNTGKPFYNQVTLPYVYRNNKRRAKFKKCPTTGGILLPQSVGILLIAELKYRTTFVIDTYFDTRKEKYKKVVDWPCGSLDFL